MNHDQWLQERMTGIGGSDAAAVCGMSKWRSAYDVYREKRGDLPPTPESEPMRWGKILEPVVRQEYADRTGRAIMVPDGILRHERHPHMLATLDGITADGRLYEGKTARTADGWGEPGTDEIPLHYMAQVQHYLVVAALDVADVAVLIGGSDFRIYEVPADRELQQMMIEVEADFWERVIAEEPPEPITYADVQARYGRVSRPGYAMATQEVRDALHTLKGARDHKMAAEQLEEAAKLVIQKAMGENETLITPDGEVLATWKLAKAPDRFDAKALAAAHPGIYAQFVAAGQPSRRFLPKF